MNPSPEDVATIVRVRGQVQGVGFRPFVCRVARDLGLVGRVSNDAAGVVIRAEGSRRALAGLREALRTAAPSSARIEAVSEETVLPVGFTSFEVEASGQSARPLVRVPHDLATCAECLREVCDPGDRRYAYPFANCTGCGPRFSLIDRLPYDRPSTSMRLFDLCHACREEYERPADRRFHAEPIACASCGPRVAFREVESSEAVQGPDAIRAAVAAIREGKIVAVKGLGGFQLLARADLSGPVARLRQRKARLTKPLAVMVPTVEAAGRLGVVGPEERQRLESPENPIVLLERRAGSQSALAPEISPRVATVGVLLPTTPLHHILLAGFDFPVVATSGNRGDDPLAIDEAEAAQDLVGIADAFLVHDRPIVRRVDDSVVRIMAGRPVTIRLARGYAPLPLPAVERLAEAARAKGVILPPVLATGGHQKVAPALWSGAQAVLGPHLGDMVSVAAREAFGGLVAGLSDLFGAEPAVLACDLHPDYFTSRWASDRALPLVRVQHHFAHAVAAMVEHDLLDREVIALTWDGTGFGTDGTIWGGEVLRARVDRFERVASLLPFPLPGGDWAIRQPRRIALGLLALALGEAEVLAGADLRDRLGLAARDAGTLLRMARRGVNSAWTSSVGRLFDAVAALVLGAGEVSYEGEAAAWLEAVADPAVSDAYPLPTHAPGRSATGVGDPSIRRGDWRLMIRAILDDLAGGTAAGVIAARFHNALAVWAVDVASDTSLRDIVLGGGCFQNRFLTERVLSGLRDSLGVRVFGPGLIPPGDGGLAAGQLAIALARWHRPSDWSPGAMSAAHADGFLP